MNVSSKSPSHSVSRHRCASIAIVTAFAVLAYSAQVVSSERVIHSTQGDVIQKTAPAGRQQTPSVNSGHPFATTEQRTAVRPMKWYEAGKNGPEKPPLAAKKGPQPNDDKSVGSAPTLSNHIARSSFPEAWKMIDAETARGHQSIGKATDVGATVYPYSRYPGNLNTSLWLSSPWNKIGKLYFNVPGGGSSYCTANVSSGNSIIITAAHCVYSRGLGWNYNFVFVPADRFGAAPYGSYGWQSATVLTDWIDVGARRHDVAMIRLTGEASNGQPVVNYVGWLGRSWDWGYEQYTASNGYASNLSTQYTHICEGWSSYEANEGADVLTQGCDMTYGSSGGGWLIQYSPYSHAGNYVNSVVSGPHIGAFGTAYVGARFTSNNIVPLCNAIGC